MRLLPALVAALLAASASPALAAPWSELPPYAVPGGAIATCMRDAGTGRLALLGRHGDIGTATDLLTVADGSGPALAASTTLGSITSCAEAGAAEGGAPLLLALTAFQRPGDDLDGGAVVTSTGAGAPTRIATRRQLTYGPAAVAVSRSGAAVAAWGETADGPEAGRVMVALRPSATAPFGPPHELGRTAWAGYGPQVGIDSAGRAHVAWLDGRVAASAIDVKVASAPPGGSFAAPRTLGSAAFGALVPALAVADDGRALLVADHGSGLVVWELAPGGRAFARSAQLPAALGEVAVALAPGGAAAIATRGADGRVDVARRTAGGAFGRPQRIRGPRPPQRSSNAVYFATFADAQATPDDSMRPQLGVRLSAAGELLVTWLETPRQASAGVAYAAHGTLAGGLGAPHRVGGPCRSVNAVQPLTLPSGRLAVAWTDNGATSAIGDTEFQRGGGRLHVTVPGGAGGGSDGAVAAAPSVRARLAPSSGLLGSGEALRLRVRCVGGPCDVRARALAARVGRSGSPTRSVPVASADSATLGAGQDATLRLQMRDGYGFAQPRRTRRVPVSLTVCTPDGEAVRRLTISPRVRGRALPPVPRIVGLTARRSGRIVRAAWRVSGPLPRGAQFLASVRDGDDGWIAIADRVTKTRDGYTAVMRNELHQEPRDVVVVLRIPNIENAGQARTPIG